MSELVRFVEERRGHRNIRAGYLERVDRKGRFHIRVPEVNNRVLVVAPDKVMKKETKN